MTINTVSTNSLSAESKNLQTLLNGKQQSLNKLTSDAEMTASDKEKEQRKIKQEIAELNRKLRHEKLKEQEENKELKKEQEKKKIIKEELLEDMNPKKEDTSDSSDASSDSPSGTRRETTKATENIPVVTLKNVLSADTAIRLSNVEEQVTRRMNNRQDILASEIASDELYGTDTTGKKEELSGLRRKEAFQITSLYQKEDTTIPTMDLGSKIIIRE